MQIFFWNKSKYLWLAYSSRKKYLLVLFEKSCIFVKNVCTVRRSQTNAPQKITLWEMIFAFGVWCKRWMNRTKNLLSFGWNVTKTGKKSRTVEINCISTRKLRTGKHTRHIPSSLSGLITGDVFTLLECCSGHPNIYFSPTAFDSSLFTCVIIQILLTLKE